MDEKEAYGILDSCTEYIGADIVDGKVLLEGNFSAEELSAIAWLMKAGKTSLKEGNGN